MYLRASHWGGLSFEMSICAGGKCFRVCVRLVFILVAFAVCGRPFSVGVLEGSNVFACEPLGYSFL